MSSQNSTALTLSEAQAFLRQFTCAEVLSQSVTLDYSTIRAALLQVADHSDYQILGICADSTAAAQQALHAYLAALGLEARPIVQAIEGSLYVKYNPKTGRHHSEPYTGASRGVLVSCQSAYDGDVNETFGHLPLDLF